MKGFDNDVEVNNLCIGTSVTAVDLPSGESIILLKNESIDHTSQLNSMLSVNQVRCNHIDIDDVPSMFEVAGRKGSQQMVVGTDENSDCVCVPFDYKNNLVTFQCRTPTNDELIDLPIYVLTSDALWDPTSINSTNHKLTFNNLLPTLTGTNINEDNRMAHGIISKRIYNLHVYAARTEAGVDIQLLLRNMLLPSDLVAQKTLEATTQLGKHMVRYPQRSHLKSRYPQLNCRQQMESVSTDTVFATVTALNGETCFQIYFAMESQFTEIYGMSTKSEGATTLLQYIKERGAPSHIHNDNSKMQTSKAWNEICNQYLIQTSTTEPYQPHYHQVMLLHAGLVI